MKIKYKLCKWCHHLNMTGVLQLPEAISLIQVLTSNNIHGKTTEKYFLDMLHTTLLPFFKHIFEILTLRTIYKGNYGVRWFINAIEQVSNIFNDIYYSKNIIVWGVSDLKCSTHTTIPSLNKKHIIPLLILIIGYNYYVQKHKQYPKTIKVIKESPKSRNLGVCQWV